MYILQTDKNITKNTVQWINNIFDFLSPVGAHEIWKGNFDIFFYSTSIRVNLGLCWYQYVFVFLKFYFNSLSKRIIFANRICQLIWNMGKNTLFSYLFIFIDSNRFYRICINIFFQYYFKIGNVVERSVK